MAENKEYYSEQIMQSIDTVVKNNLNKVKFDKTEICTIVQQDKEDKTKYLVTTDGGLTFYAYSNNEKTIYSKGSTVYVTIPQGNYEFKKIITDKYSNNNEEVQLYTKPFDNFVIRNTIMFSEITASNPGDFYVNINDLYKYNFDYLGLEFTGLSSGISGGKYFIKIDFCKFNGDSLLSTEEQNLLTLSSEQITGNPYNLITGLKFYHLFPFEQFNKYLKNENLELIKISLDITELTGDNINISITPILYLGYDINGENLQNRELELYSTTGEYEYDTETDYYIIAIDWYRSQDKNYIYNANQFGYYTQYLTTPKNYILYYLRYEIGYSKTDQDIQESGIYWKTIDSFDLEEYTLVNEIFRYYIDDIANYLNQTNVKFKVGIKGKSGTEAEGFYIESNIITFNNLSKPQGAEGSYLAEDTLYFTLDSGDDGIYNNYGIDNKILSGSTNDTHKITVDFKNNFNFLECNPKTVIWKIPKIGSMLLPPKKINPDTGRYYNEEEVAEGKYPFNPDWEIGTGEYQNYYIYKNTVDNDAHTIEFRNSDQFSYSKTNNLISCEIEYENVIYQGSFRLQYGSQGTSGSNYAFNIYPDSPGGILMDIGEPGPISEITFAANLESNTGEKVEINTEETPIKWTLLDNTAFLQEGISVTLDTNILGSSYFNILVATLENFTDENGNKINLKAYYPIPRIQSFGYYIEGASKIVYDFQGTNPICDNSQYKLFSYNGEIKEIIVGLPIKWKIIYKDLNAVQANYPSLQPIREVDGYRLQPTATFNPSLSICAIKAYYLTGTTEKDLFVQPIVILQNTYAFPLLNAWDESTYIDPAEGIIMSQLIGAGTKNADNQYTGVLMGSLSKAGAAAITGIYGFQDGALRYKLDEKSGFYVGNSDNNFISFNEGNDRSGNNELCIKANNFILNTNNLTIDSTATGDNEYAINFKNKFIVKGNGSATIGGWHIDSDRLYGGTVGMAPEGGTYWAFWAGSSNSSSAPFKVGHDGSLVATNANISGTISANSGAIGGWKIETNRIVHVNQIAPNNYTNLTLSTNLGEPALYLTQSDVANALFRLDWSGNIICNTGIFNNVTVKGTLQAGSILGTGGFSVDNGHKNSMGLKLGTFNIGKTAVSFEKGYLSAQWQGDTVEEARWYAVVFAANEWENGSDRRLKNSINDFNDKYEVFFDKLHPVTFKYNNGRSGRIHSGFIAQEVVTSLEEADLSTMDFAAPCLLNYNTEQEGYWWLRRDQFVALNTWQIQKLKARVAELEKEIKEIKNETNQFKNI